MTFLFPPTSIREQIDHFIYQQLNTLDSPIDLKESMLYAVKQGGKRFRPFLVLSSAKLFSVPEENALAVASAVELIHAYSLVHDDLPALDNALTRRGKSSCWSAFGEGPAILVGDALIPLAFDILSRPTTHPDCSVRLNLIRGLAEVCGTQGMVAGQYLDIMFSQSHHREVEELIQMQALKTGRLFRFCCQAGPILAQASPEDLKLLTRFGDLLGALFQITDDLLDEKEDFRHSAQGTCPSILSFMDPQGVQEMIDAIEEEGYGYLKSFGENAQVLRDVFHWLARRHKA